MAMPLRWRRRRECGQCRELGQRLLRRVRRVREVDASSESLAFCIVLVPAVIHRVDIGQSVVHNLALTVAGSR